MRALRVAMAFCVALALPAACAQAPQRPHGQAPTARPDSAPLALIPWPARVERSPGADFVLTSTTVVTADTSDAAATSAARYFVDELSMATGIDLRVVAADAGSPVDVIAFRSDPVAGMPVPGAYQLDVASNHIVVHARTAQGLFYGGVTLWQLLTPGGNARPAHIPALHIEDWPRFRWRGLMLDSARHFQPVASIEKLLDEMSLHKLNVFQWHLTDDQGWRIAIARYPELTKIGAWRKPVGPDVALAGHDGMPGGKYGGYYTPEDIREIVRYAAARHITVVPEIEMPGHAQAAIASYPQYGVTGKRPDVSSDWGVHTFLYNVDERTFRFLDNVLDEVMTLFPGPYIHIGGDEAVKDQWQASKPVQRRMRALGIKDEDAMQAWFVARIGRHIDAHGRKLVGWDEILQGGAPAGAIVVSWRGAQGAIDAAKLGHDTVMSPSPAMYFDHLQSSMPDEPTGRPDVVSLRDVYDFEPVPKELDAQRARHVLGAQANLWSEYLTTPARVEHAVFPRMDALSEVLWPPRDARDWQGFLQRMPAQLARYRALRTAYADDAFAVTIEARATGASSARVALSTQTGLGAIRYSLDGSAPSLSSPLYRGPFDAPMPATIRATAFADDQPLATPRDARLDPAALLKLRSDQLRMCRNALPLRLEDGADGGDVRYNIDILDPCWIYPGLDVRDIGRIDVRIGSVPDNFQLWHDAAKIVTRPAHEPGGELEIHRDTCDGPLLASLRLGGLQPAKPVTLHAVPIDKSAGRHDLCLFFTGRSPGFLRAIDWVAPIPR